jgi:hypothetical protein
MDIMPLVLRPMEQLSHMTDQTAMKGTPTAVPLFQPIKGVFPGFADNHKISFDEISDAVDMNETHIYHGIHQLNGSLTVIFANAGSGEMALNTKLLENLFHLDIQVSKRLLKNRFDLALKFNFNFAMHKEASILWFM